MEYLRVKANASRQTANSERVMKLAAVDWLTQTIITIIIKKLTRAEREKAASSLESKIFVSVLRKLKKSIAIKLVEVQPEDCTPSNVSNYIR